MPPPSLACPGRQPRSAFDKLERAALGQLLAHHPAIYTLAERALVTPQAYCFTLPALRVSDPGRLVSCAPPDHDDAYASCQVHAEAEQGGASAARAAGGSTTSPRCSPAARGAVTYAARRSCRPATSSRRRSASGCRRPRPGAERGSAGPVAAAASGRGIPRHPMGAASGAADQLDRVVGADRAVHQVAEFAEISGGARLARGADVVPG
jgi:hypothetical protein